MRIAERNFLDIQISVTRVWAPTDGSTMRTNDFNFATWSTLINVR
jgi:hypothetical protein